MSSKKAQFSMENIIALVLVIIVILAVLMFLFKDNLLGYLEIIPGYELPEDDEKVVGVGELVGEGSCSSNRIAVQGDLKGEIVEKRWFWDVKINPVYIQVGDNEFLDLGLSFINNKDLRIKIAENDFIIGEVIRDDGKNVLILNDMLFDLNSELHQRIRVEALLEGKDSTSLQINLRSHLAPLHYSFVQPALENNVAFDFCDNVDALKINYGDGWIKSEGIGIINIPLNDFRPAPKKSRWKFWDSTTKYFGINIPSEIYSLNDEKGTIEKWQNILVIKRRDLPIGAILPDGSIWIPRSHGYSSDNVKFNEAVILNIVSPTNIYVSSSLEFAEGRDNFFESNLILIEPGFSNLFEGIGK